MNSIIDDFVDIKRRLNGERVPTISAEVTLALWLTQEEYDALLKPNKILKERNELNITYPPGSFRVLTVKNESIKDLLSRAVPDFSEDKEAESPTIDGVMTTRGHGVWFASHGNWEVDYESDS